MISISLCMIVKNEAESIANCLDSVKDIADEINIVDTGSYDRTKEIVGKYTDRIFDFVWIDDFAAARNFSFSHATKDYILWLDADDVLLEEDRKKLLELKQSMAENIDSVTMIYNYAFDQFGKVILSLRRNRLVKRVRSFTWHGAIHEYLAVNGNITNSDIAVTHRRVHGNSHRNIKIYDKLLEKHETFAPRDMYYYANELMNHSRYEEAVKYYKQFLDSEEGWIEDNISACDKLADIYQNSGDEEQSKKYIYKSFEYDTPRAEFCCRLGYQYRIKNDFKKAIFWYKTATQLERDKDNWGFSQEAYWTWVPHLQLCICYYAVEDYQKAYSHNEMARSYRPDDKDILHNKKLLENLLKIEPENAEQTDIAEPDFSGHRPLKIVQVAPDYYPIPPKDYGGIERMVYEITEELVKQGHEVYLYALKGSSSKAHIIPYEHSGGNHEEIARYVKNTLPEGVDIIHDHTHLSMVGKLGLSIPSVCTIHSARNNGVKYPVYASKRAYEIFGKKQGSYIYHGINPDNYQYSEEKKDYLLFLGVLDWHKGIVEAIEVAEKTNQKLIIAGPVLNGDYFKNQVEPRILKSANLEYAGSVGGETKQNLLKYAKCMLFPTMCEEPFGLVMIEAMICGTPVLAMAHGAVPEVMKGFPGLICHSVKEMTEKVLNGQFPNPQELREYVMNNFTAEIMTKEYLKTYHKAINKK